MGLFMKEGSSKSSKSDAPLRNSDRRKLRQAVESKLVWLPPPPTSSSNDGEEEEDGGGTANSISMVGHLLNDIFLDNTANILVRKVKLPKNKNNTIVHPTVTIYFRTPSNHKSNGKSNTATATATANNTVNDGDVRWPYCSSMNHNMGKNMKSNSNNGNVPILMEVEDGDKQKYLVPTIALLSVLPMARIPIVTVPDAVSKYICRGADLMRSGVMAIAPAQHQQQQRPLVQLCVHNNPQPFAIGFMTPDTNTHTVGPSSKGIAVQILTYYGDDISRPYVPTPNHNNNTMSLLGGGDTYANGNYANVGFEDGSYVYSLQQQQQQPTPMADNADDILWNSGFEQTNNQQVSDSENDMNTSKLGQLQITQKNESTTGDEIKPPPQCASNDASHHETEEEEEEEISQDEILLQAFHNALLLISPKTDLPMLVSTFYSKYVLPSRPADTTIHIKQTSFQKFGTFLLYQQQQSSPRPIIKTKGNAQDAVAMLIDINRNHVHLKDAKLRKNNNIATQATNNTNTNDLSTTKTKLAAVNLHLIPPNVAKLMRLDNDIVKAVNAKSDFRKNTGFLTAPECRNILETYLTQENLIPIDEPESVILDGPLTDIIYRKNKNKQPKKPNTAATRNSNDRPSEMTRKELHTQWITCLEKGYAFVQMPGTKIMAMKRGSPPKVHIVVESRQKRKFVTRLTGLEEYFIDPTEFANFVSKRFACASSVEEKTKSTTSNKKHALEMEFQGHLAEELTALLLGNDKLSSHGGVKDSPYSIPKGVISIQLRKGASKRKN